jgi:hypothetical protein
MMRMIAMTVLSSVLLLPVPAAAKTNSQVTLERPADGKAGAAERKVCRRIQETGSNLWERICLTKEEWKQVDEMK